ncbi:MAG TPA: D-glycerate dehydrogenase [Syntrophales bacterium]|nr:D-glycerate dehydrogenase [Syntrophales bacterium]
MAPRGKKVLVTGNLPKAVLADLEREAEVTFHPEDRPMGRDELLGLVGDIDGLLAMITDHIDEELLDRAPLLRVVSNMAVGYNNIDVAAATRRGVLVTNTPGVLTEATADLAFALLLAAARRVVEGDRMVRQGRFRFWAPFLFLGTEVSGRTLGIVGMGRIGRAVAKRAAGFAMEILYYNRHRLDRETEEHYGARFCPLEDLLARADFVSLHVPLSDETRHLIDAKALALMKPTAFLINTSRGPVVDEKALVSALRRGVIAGAGLDVYEDEPRLAPGLAELDNVVLLPHVGSATTETRTKMARLAARNLLAALRGETPPHPVNPEVLAKRSGKL